LAGGKQQGKGIELALESPSEVISYLLMQNINKKQEFLCFASVSTYIGVWAKPTLVGKDGSPSLTGQDIGEKPVSGAKEWLISFVSFGGGFFVSPCKYQVKEHRHVYRYPAERIPQGINKSGTAEVTLPSLHVRDGGVFYFEGNDVCRRYFGNYLQKHLRQEDDMI